MTGQTVSVMGSESSKPLFMECLKCIIKSGGNVIMNYLPDNTDRFGFNAKTLDISSDSQLSFFPKKFMKGFVDEIDHYLYIYCENDPRALANVDPKKNMLHQKTFTPFVDWRNEKENQGKLTWTTALYPTEAMAKEANLTLDEYWAEIVNACFLDESDPLKKWAEIFTVTDQYLFKLNNLSEKIERLHIIGKDVDLSIKLGESRKWVGCNGRNIPSFEIFTSPDARDTNGWAKFNQPVYRNGALIKDIFLNFKDGKIVDYSASEGQEVLKQMISVENADKVGEFSLTDKRFSRITKFMANTLFDENMGGKVREFSYSNW